MHSSVTGRQVAESEAGRQQVGAEHSRQPSSGRQRQGRQHSSESRHSACGREAGRHGRTEQA